MKKIFIRQCCALCFLMLCLCVFTARAEARIGEETVRAVWAEVCRVADVEPLPLFIDEDEDNANAHFTPEDEKFPEGSPRRSPHVVMYTGYMRILETDDEMFAILAHELGHSVLQHMERQAVYLEEADASASMMSVSLGGGRWGLNQAEIAKLNGFMELRRMFELEADAFAVDLAVKAGRDPVKGSISAKVRAGMMEGELQFESLVTHPSHRYRMAAMKERITAHREGQFDAPPVNDDSAEIAELEKSVEEQRALMEARKRKLAESKKKLEELKK